MTESPAAQQTLPEPEILSQVPELTVSCEEDVFSVTSGNYAWSAPGENGEMSAVIACGEHPLDRFHQKDFRVVAGQSAVLSFPAVPDEISVRCWPSSALGNTTQLERMLTVENLTFSLEDGDWVYEITAVWERDTWNGQASYYLYLSK